MIGVDGGYRLFA